MIGPELNTSYILAVVEGNHRFLIVLGHLIGSSLKLVNNCSGKLLAKTSKI